MELDVTTLARQWGLDDLEEMRLTELLHTYPEETQAMQGRGELRSYLASWRRSAEDYLGALMDPNNPAGAWKAVGATQELRHQDPELWTKRARMVEPTAREMLVRTMVLAPLPGAAN